MTDSITPSPVTADQAETLAHPEEPGLALEDYDWHPVLRRKRADGWTPALQRRFIETLADTGSVDAAARSVNQSRQSAYQLRRAPGSEGFSAAWAAAIDAASQGLLDEAFERATVGSDEPVFGPGGAVIGRRHKKSDRLLMFLLRAYYPDRFRHAARDTKHSGESAPPPLAPVATALEQLGPPCPPEPHLLIDADELEVRLQCADILEGELPHWLGEREPAPNAPQTQRFGPLGEAFERGLENAKRAGRSLPPLIEDDWAAHREHHFSGEARRQE